MHGVARAALEGELDAERLRAMPVELALAELQQLPGVGPWTASHILFRGAALRDVAERAALASRPKSRAAAEGPALRGGPR